MFSISFFTLTLNVASLTSTIECCDVFLQEQKYPEDLTVDSQLKSSNLITYVFGFFSGK